MRYVNNFRLQVMASAMLIRIVLYLGMLGVLKIIEIQKINNYKTCVSFVNMAKKMGGVQDERPTHEICKHYLD